MIKHIPQRYKRLSRDKKYLKGRFWQVVLLESAERNVYICFDCEKQTRALFVSQYK